MPNFVMAILIAITILAVLALIWVVWNDIDNGKY